MSVYADYYAILGVAPGATRTAIRQAYITRARQFHPDLNPGNRNAQAQMCAINEAYATLSDPARRREYDARRNTAYVPAPPASYCHSPRSSAGPATADVTYVEVPRASGAAAGAGFKPASASGGRQRFKKKEPNLLQLLLGLATRLLLGR